MVGQETDRVAVIRYTNYRGETTLRRIIPRAIRFASTEWHPAEQWLLDAYDLDKGAVRTFAMKDILEWLGRLSIADQTYKVVRHVGDE
jgi:predicted DNA-binding transcriptional regulator YafY